MKIFRPFLEIYRYRKIIWSTTVYDVKTKYIGSTLGYLWAVLYPLLFLGLYAVVYLTIYKIRLKALSPCEYVLLIFCGLVPFLSFADALSRGVFCVTANSNLIKNTLFPIEFLPINIVISSQIMQVIGFLILTIVLMFFKRIGYNYFFLFLIWLEQILFTVGLVWFLSAINVFLKDMGQLISVLILMLMMISPISYTEEMIPTHLRIILYINPLYYLIMLYQKILLFNEIEIRLLIIFSIISLSCFISGYYFFLRLKIIFSDYV